MCKIEGDNLFRRLCKLPDKDKKGAQAALMPFAFQKGVYNIQGHIRVFFCNLAGKRDGHSDELVPFTVLSLPCLEETRIYSTFLFIG